EIAVRFQDSRGAWQALYLNGKRGWTCSCRSARGPRTYSFRETSKTDGVRRGPDPKASYPINSKRDTKRLRLDPDERAYTGKDGLRPGAFWRFDAQGRRDPTLLPDRRSRSGNQKTGG